MGNVCTKQLKVVPRDKTESGSKQIENATDLKLDQSPEGKIISDEEVKQDVEDVSVTDPINRTTDYQDDSAKASDTKQELSESIAQSSSLWRFSSTEVIPDANPAIRDSLVLTHSKQSAIKEYTAQFHEIEEESKTDAKSVKFKMP